MASRAEGAGGVSSLTRREREVLGAVGRRLSNAELAAELHVSVRTVESHVAALRRKLGATSRGELIEVATHLARSAAVAGPDSSFVGRDVDLAEVGARLETDQLITLLGPAGVGKSRLARELARRSTREVRLADLVGVAEDGVLVAVADAVGVSAAEGADVEGGVRLALADRDLLLVVDNADDVTGAVGPLAVRLAESVPRIRILVTSRRRLGLPQEWVHVVAPLPVPAGVDDLVEPGAYGAVGGGRDGGAETRPDPMASPAVRLLVDRARSARSDFTVGAADEAAVVSLCRRLDGLPLALELAAARLASMDVAELDAVVADRMDLLGRPDPDVRHRSLVAALEGSLAGLGVGERLVLLAVASLPGPATLDELRAVVASAAGTGDEPTTDTGDEPATDTARAVLDLVDQSLLEPRLRPGATTYRTLEVVRAVVLEGADPELLHRVRAAHAAHHADRVEDAVRRSRAAEGWDYDDEVARRTLLGAMRWAAEHDPELGARLLVGVAARYELDPTVAVLDGLRRVVLDHGVPGGWRAGPLAWAAVVLNYLDLDVMDRVAAIALERAETDEERAIGNWGVGFAAGYLGREEEALAALARAERGFRELGDEVMVGLTLMAEGLIRTDANRAVATLEASLLTCLSAGDRWHANSVRSMLARRAIEAGVRLDEVPLWLDECDEFARQSDSLRHDRAHALAARAEWAAIVAGQTSSGEAVVTASVAAPGEDASSEGASELAARAAEAFRHHGDLRCLVRALLLQARTEPDPTAAVTHARRAVGAAILQGDPRAQRSALEVVVEQAGRADDLVLEARARGGVHRLAGRDGPPAPDLEGPARTAVLEGFAQGPTLVALGPNEPSPAG